MFPQNGSNVQKLDLLDLLTLGKCNGRCGKVRGNPQIVEIQYEKICFSFKEMLILYTNVLYGDKKRDMITFSNF